MNTITTRVTRYTDTELEEFSQLITDKINQAEQQFSFYQQQIIETGASPDSKRKNLDDGTSSAELERLHMLAGRQNKIIQHLHNAQLRIKNKVYGVCRETGILISKNVFARFLMLP